MPRFLSPQVRQGVSLANKTVFFSIWALIANEIASLVVGNQNSTNSFFSYLPPLAYLLETVYYFVPKSTRVAWSSISGLLSLQDKSATATIITSKAEATNIASDPSEIPSFWMGNTDIGVAYVPNWDNLWDFKRCLAKGNASIAVSEVFNGDPWCRRGEDYTRC